MPKKQVRNAFYFFMKELEPKLKREGRALINGIADIVPIAHPKWKELSEEEKQRYEYMAREYKAKMRGSEGDNYKMDNVGNIISKRVNVADVNQKRRHRERRDVTGKWIGKDILEEKFYLIHFETLCKTQDGDYLPCELAVVEYSLQRGIIKKFHRFIEPGPIPTGYRYVCMNTSEETHQIPLENFEKADNNYMSILLQLQNFLNPSEELPEYPPFYCLAEKRDMVQYCIDWIQERSRRGQTCRIRKVYCLEDLLMDLYVHGEGPKISQSGCLDILTSHHWDYTSNTRCDFHEELECKYCSLAVVQRYAFAFSDALSVIFQFKLTDKHLPSTAEDDSPCVILPPAPMDNRHFNGPPKHSQSYSSGQGRRNVYGRSEQPEVEEDDNDTSSLYSNTESLKTSLRRPNVSGIALSGNAWNSVYNKPTASAVNANGPSSVGARNPYAGNAPPPHPSTLTKPLAAWQNSAEKEGTIFGQSNIPMQQDELSSANKPIRPPFTSMRPLGPQGMAPPHTMFAMRGVQPAGGRLQMSLGMAGRGSNMNVQSMQPSVGRGYAPPVGRGYAPPGIGRGGVGAAPSVTVGGGTSSVVIGSAVAPSLALGRGGGGIAPSLTVGRGYAPPVGRGYAVPVGRGYTPPGVNAAERQMNGLSMNN